MRILIATDAWHPQVNGVVRTLTSLARSAAGLGAEIAFLTPEGFPSFALPTYPGLRVAWPNRREIARRAAEFSHYALAVSLEDCQVHDEHGFSAPFPIDEFSRHCLLNGLDHIGLTLRHDAEISAYEARNAAQAPKLRQG